VCGNVCVYLEGECICVYWCVFLCMCVYLCVLNSDSDDVVCSGERERGCVCVCVCARVR